MAKPTLSCTKTKNMREAFDWRQGGWSALRYSGMEPVAYGQNGGAEQTGLMAVFKLVVSFLQKWLSYAKWHTSDVPSWEVVVLDGLGGLIAESDAE